MLNLKSVRRTLSGLCVVGLCLAGLPASPIAAAPVKVRLVKSAKGFELLRGGKPYFVKGAGGGYSLAALHAAGGNSDRTWGADGIGKQLDAAAKLHMTMLVGFWLGHPGDGFNYHNAAAVQAQYEQCKKYVLEYRNDPAVLAWGIGNEMENGYDHKILWQAVEKIAKMCHRLDPNHPTVTVVAEIGGHKVQKINEYCPDIDIIGINSYGGGASLYRRYLKAGGVKPYLITEFGPPGTWEIGRDDIGLPVEETSTQKALAYAATYRHSVLNTGGMCLGSYAFTWGWKVEATPTWFGLFLPNGRRLGAVDYLQHFWTGKWPAHLCPVMKSIAMQGGDKLAPGTVLHAHVLAAQPGGGALTYHWILRRDISKLNIAGGLGGAMPTAYKKAIVQNGADNVTVKMPQNGGYYRLFCYVYNTHNGAAVGNLPLQDTAKQRPMRAPVAQIPLVLAGHGANSPFIPAGWMGDYAAIGYDGNCRTDPHAGKSCVKISFKQANGWGGIAWQDPANDWGKTYGGLNLKKAKTLSFWARGKAGGETVTFGVGLIGSDQTYHDTVHLSRKITLGTHWKKYSLDLKGKNLYRVITGFYWTGGANGAPFAFYLSNISYQ